MMDRQAAGGWASAVAQRECGDSWLHEQLEVGALHWVAEMWA